MYFLKIQISYYFCWSFLFCTLTMEKCYLQIYIFTSFPEDIYVCLLILETERGRERERERERERDWQRERNIYQLPPVLAMIRGQTRHCLGVQTMLQPSHLARAPDIFYTLYLFIFRERGKQEEREREKYQWERETSIGCLLYVPCPLSLQTHNQGMCPDRKSNQRHLALRDDTQPTEPHWSGKAPDIF